MLKHKNCKVSISGDLHLNLRAVGVGAADWERDRFIALFEELAGNDSDIIILNGDIFDKAKPTFLEIGLFYEVLNLLNKKTVYVIDGNHEELSATQTVFDYLPEAGFNRIKVGSLDFDKVSLWLVGHPHISNIEKDLLPITFDKKNILISHYRSDIGYADAEIDNELVSNRFDDTILSDIHYRLFPAHNIQYTSSPYGIHYTPDKDYGYCVIDITNAGYEIEFIKLALPSKVKLTTTLENLEDTLTQLDKANKYNLEISGASTTENLAHIGKYPSVNTFSFSEEVQEDYQDIANDLKTSSDDSISDIIMLALEDVELNTDELTRAKKILAEVL